jgi:hypothetical protein
MNIETTGLINYAYGLLNEESAHEMKKRIQSDEFLKIEYLEIKQLMKEYPGEDIEELIKKLTRTPVCRKKFLYNFKSTVMYPIGIAATLVVIIGVYYFFMNPSNQVTQSDMSISDIQIVFNDHVEYYPFEEKDWNVSRNTHKPFLNTEKWKNNIVNTLVSVLQSNDPKEAIINIKSSDSIICEITYLSAVALMKKERYKEADDLIKLIDCKNYKNKELVREKKNYSSLYFYYKVWLKGMVKKF